MKVRDPAVTRGGSRKRNDLHRVARRNDETTAVPGPEGGAIQPGIWDLRFEIWNSQVVEDVSI
jgi:hypothetical protein